MVRKQTLYMFVLQKDKLSITFKKKYRKDPGFSCTDFEKKQYGNKKKHIIYIVIKMEADIRFWT